MEDEIKVQKQLKSKLKADLEEEQRQHKENMRKGKHELKDLNSTSDELIEKYETVKLQIN